MPSRTWVVDGRKADQLTLARILAEERAAKLARMRAIRDQLLDELGTEVDDRALSIQVRRRYREEIAEQRRLEADLRRVGAIVRKIAREQSQRAIYVLAQPYPPRESRTSSNKSFDTMLGLVEIPERKRDGLCSFHCKFTSRGFGERREDRSRVYKPGEAVGHLIYIIRDEARELSQGGLVSNISHDPAELAAFFAALEHLEEQDRDNANVYMSLVVSLPHELTPEGREAALAEICSLLQHHDLPFVGVLHAPDPQGDPRNFHTHIMFSLRPCEIVEAGQYGFSPHKHSDLNDAAFIEPFRHQVSDILNRAMERENHGRRFTPLSDAARGLEPRSKRSGKSTIGRKHWERKEQQLALMQREHAIRTAYADACQRLTRSIRNAVAQPSRDRSQILTGLRQRATEALLRRKATVTSAAQERARRLATAAAQIALVGRLRLDDLSDRLDHLGRSVKRLHQILPEGSPPANSLGASQEDVARTQPAQNPDAQRGSGRRKAIATAVRRLRWARFPGQVRVGGRFALHPDWEDRLPDVHLFEAEVAIQRAHRLRRRQMLSAVRAKVDAAEHSPFRSDTGPAHLNNDVLDGSLRQAFNAAASDPDILLFLEELRTTRLQREAKAAKERKQEATRATQRLEVKIARQLEAANRLRPAVEAILARISKMVETGQLSRMEHNAIHHDVATVAKAAVEGRLIMRLTSGDYRLFVASEALRAAAERLTATPSGQKVLLAVGKLTLDEALDHSDLPVSWAVPTPISAGVQTAENTPAGFGQKGRGITD